MLVPSQEYGSVFVIFLLMNSVLLFSYKGLSLFWTCVGVWYYFTLFSINHRTFSIGAIGHYICSKTSRGKYWINNTKLNIKHQNLFCVINGYKRCMITTAFKIFLLVRNFCDTFLNIFTLYESVTRQMLLVPAAGCNILTTVSMNVSDKNI